MTCQTAETNEPWKAYLNEGLLRCNNGTVEHDMGTILQNLLLSRSKNEGSASIAAHQIDNYYWERNLDSGPFFNWDGRLETYADPIDVIYTAIVGMAPKIHYNDERQDILVQLLAEFRGIPPKPYKAWNVCFC